MSLRSTGGGWLRLHVRALNLPQILAAYGGDVIERVQASMLAAVSHYFQAGAFIRKIVGVDAHATLTALIQQSDGAIVRVKLPRCLPTIEVTLLLEGLSQALAIEPVKWGSEWIYVAPSVSISDIPTEDMQAGGNVPPLVGATPAIAEAYRRDMAEAAQLLRNLANNELRFAYQPIRMAGRSGNLIYAECLLRLPYLGGAARQTGREVAAMERLGLVRVLDNHMIWHAIDQLQLDPTLRLGVNISAQSACSDAWWKSLECRLKAERQLAQRLIIEITETSEIPSISEASAFVTRMRMLGCKIALDDFGVGRDAIRNLYALRPDIVKIDKYFLHQARCSSNGQAALQSLVGFARAISGLVIVEGVETQADSDAALAAGLHWQQGYFIDRPQMGSTQGCEMSA